MNGRKIFVMLMVVCGIFFAAGAALAAPEFTIKVGTIVAETHPDMVVMNKVFKPYIEEKSGGRIKVELYPNAQLGGDRELSESLQMGTIQIALPASSAMAGFDKRIQVLDLPFLFTTREAAFEALDGEMGAKITDMLMAKGFMALGYYENGFRHVTNSKKPIHSPADMAGMKIRTMENPMHISFFKKLGANPTPMSFGELYSALQQGTVVGQENPFTLIYDSKFFEVQKYVSTTGHVFSVTMLLGSKKFIDKLPEDLKQVVIDGANAFVAEHRKMMVVAEVENIQKLKDAGMEINVLTPEEKKSFVEATAATYEEFAKVLGADMIELAKKYQK